MNTTRAMVWFLSLCVSSALGCGGNDATNTPSTAAEAPIPVPAELQFKKIEQEFQQSQQQQQQGKCPQKFIMVFQDTGQVTIKNQQGQEIVRGKVSQNDLARVAIAANQAVESRTQDQNQAECQNENEGEDDPYFFDSDAQTTITDNSDQSALVSTKQQNKFCDFTKDGKGRQLHQQLCRVAQQSCGGTLPPLPEPRMRPTPRPRSEPMPMPTPTPTSTPTPTVTPTPTPTPRATPTPTPTASPTISARDWNLLKRAMG